MRSVLAVRAAMSSTHAPEKSLFAELRGGGIQARAARLAGVAGPWAGGDDQRCDGARRPGGRHTGTVVNMAPNLAPLQHLSRRPATRRSEVDAAIDKNCSGARRPGG